MSRERSSKIKWGNSNWPHDGCRTLLWPLISASPPSIHMDMQTQTQLLVVQFTASTWRHSMSMLMQEAISLSSPRFMEGPCLEEQCRSELQVHEARRRDQSPWLGSPFLQELLHPRSRFLKSSLLEIWKPGTQLGHRPSKKLKPVSSSSCHHPSLRRIFIPRKQTARRSL